MEVSIAEGASSLCDELQRWTRSRAPDPITGETPTDPNRLLRAHRLLEDHLHAFLPTHRTDAENAALVQRLERTEEQLRRNDTKVDELRRKVARRDK